jgi:hypothetical protein
MPRRWLTSGIVLTLAILPYVQPRSVRAADADTSEPAATVRIKSIDGLVSDVLYLAKLVGKEEEAKQGEAFFRSMVPGDDSAGIDTKRPIGFYGSVREDVKNSPGVVLIPMTTEKAFLDFLERFNVEAKKDKDDIYTVTTNTIPVPVEIFLRFAHKYAYVTVQSKEHLAKDRLIEVSKVVGGSGDPILSASFHIDRVPKGLKDVGLGFMDLGINQQIKYPPAATKAQKELLQETVKTVSKQIGSFVKEGSSVHLSLDLDRKANVVVLETTVNSKKGSRLANDITDLGQAKSLFAGMRGTDAAMSLVAHVSAPGNLRQIIAPAIDEAFQKLLEKEQDANARALGERFFKALAPTVKAGELDMINELFGPGKDQHYTSLSGVKVVEGKEIEDALRAIVAILPPQVKESVKLDAETAGDAKIHRLDLQAQYDPGAQQIIGSNPIYVTIRPNMILVSTGPDGLKVIKSAMGAQPAAGPLFQLHMSMARLAPAFGKMAATRGDKNAAEYIEKAGKEAFPEGKAEDEVRVTIEAGEQLRTKVAVKAPVLMFLGKLAPRVAETRAPGAAK